MCCRYLYKSTSQGVLDYLCNRLYTLPEKEVERYLSQLCQMVYQRPGSSLERVLVDLCAQSLRVAVKARGAPPTIFTSVEDGELWSRSSIKLSFERSCVCTGTAVPSIQ